MPLFRCYTSSKYYHGKNQSFFDGQMSVDCAEIINVQIEVEKAEKDEIVLAFCIEKDAN